MNYLVENQGQGHNKKRRERGVDRRRKEMGKGRKEDREENREGKQEKLTHHVRFNPLTTLEATWTLLSVHVPFL